MSPTEKLYYSVVVLVSAVSVLLSPFFYVRRGAAAKARKPVAWRWIAASYLIIGGVLLALWYVIFFKQ